MFRQIDKYAMQWNPAKNEGRAVLHLIGGGYYLLAVKEVNELYAVTDLLRNEKPVFIHTKTGQISTSWEPTGEGEL